MANQNTNLQAIQALDESVRQMRGENLAAMNAYDKAEMEKAIKQLQEENARAIKKHKKKSTKKKGGKRRYRRKKRTRRRRGRGWGVKQGIDGAKKRRERFKNTKKNQRKKRQKKFRGRRPPTWDYLRWRFERLKK